MQRHRLTFDISDWQTSAERQGEFAVTLGRDPRTQKRFTIKVPQDTKPHDIPHMLRHALSDQAQRVGIHPDHFHVGICKLDALVPYQLHVTIYTDLFLHVQFNVHAHPS